MAGTEVFCWTLMTGKKGWTSEHRSVLFTHQHAALSINMLTYRDNLNIVEKSCLSAIIVNITLRQNVMEELQEYREVSTEEVSLCTSGVSFSTQEICSNRVWQRRSTQCCTFSDSSRSSLSVSETWCVAKAIQHQTTGDMNTYAQL